MANNARENKLRKLSWIMSPSISRRGWRKTDSSSSHLETNGQRATLPFSVFQFKSPHLASLQLEPKRQIRLWSFELWI
jgi:hypothetical protein